MRRIQILATGGTIASRAAESGHTATVRAAELLASLRTLPPDIEVTAADVTTRGSYALDTADILGLAREVKAALVDDIDGVVVTHGTDVMEETAFLLDLVHDDVRPVVLTGAQRPHDDPARDGPRNLRDAVQLAASLHARDRGVMICFDGFAYAACGVTKADTLSMHAFHAPGRGPLMRLGAGYIEELCSSLRAAPLALDIDDVALPRVDVIPAYPGADGALLRASLGAGAVGAVIAASARAMSDQTCLTRSTLPSVRLCRCSFVRASRPVRSAMYAGGGAALAEIGAMLGSDLSPWQGRILLAMAIANAPRANTRRSCADGSSRPRTPPKGHYPSEGPRPPVLGSETTHDQADLCRVRRGCRRRRGMARFLRRPELAGRHIARDVRR